MADAFRFLADPTRRRRVELAAHRERSVSKLVRATRLRQPVVSKQLAVLRKGRLMDVRREGRRRLCRTRTEELRKMREWPDRQAPAWNARLDALKHRLDRV